MRHRGWKLGAVVVLLASLARPCASLAQGALPDPTFLQAKGLFEALEYAQAIAVLDVWIAAVEARPVRDPSQRDLVVSAYEMRAISRFANSNRTGAQSDFASLLTLDPHYVRTVQLAPALVVLFNAARAATVTTLMLRVTPVTAEVTLDGAPIVVGEALTIDVAVGEHVVTARQLGYRDTTESAQAQAGQANELSLSLVRVSSVVSILTSPSNVDVVIDGISRGKTAAGPPPAKFTDAVAHAGLSASVVSSPLVVVDLSVGSHLVEFRRDCYVVAQRRLEIDKPADFTIEPITLDRAVASLSARANQPGVQVFVDGQLRGAAPLTMSDLCEGEHAVELRSAVGRYSRRIQARTGDNIDIVGTMKPAFALVSATTGAAVLNTDLRVVAERLFEPAQHMTLFAPPSDQVDQAVKAQQLPPGWFDFDGRRRPLGVWADISASIRQDLSTRLTKVFDAQGIASVTVPSSLDRNRIVVSLLAAGSGQPDVLEVGLNNPESVRAAIAQLDRTLAFFRPSIGLTTIDVADVAGGVVTGVDSNGPAAKAGVQVGDVLLKANGQAVTDAVAFATALAGQKANDDVTLELKARNGSSKRAELKVLMTPRLIGIADQNLLANNIVADLRARLAAALDPLEESVIRLNLAAALARLEAWSDARAELERVKLPDGPGVANGTVLYLMGLCADKLGNRSESEAALKKAAASDSLLTEDGPSIKELAEAKLAELHGKQ